MHEFQLIREQGQWRGNDSGTNRKHKNCPQIDNGGREIFLKSYLSASLEIFLFILVSSPLYIIHLIFTKQLPLDKIK